MAYDFKTARPNPGPQPKTPKAKTSESHRPAPTASIPVEAKGLPRLRLGQKVHVVVVGTVKGIMDGYEADDPARLEVADLAVTVEAKAPTMDEAGTMGWERMKKKGRSADGEYEA